MSDKNLIPFTPLVQSLPASVPFVGPETLERQRGRVFDTRIGANESAFGMSPKARAAMLEAVETASWYGDPENYDLRTALADYHGVGLENIMVGAGIDGILGNTVRMLAGTKTPVVTSAGAYPTFNYHVAGFGAQLVAVPYKRDSEDPDAIIEKMTEIGAPLGYFANPDNPMGSWYAADQVQMMIDRVPDGAVLVLDEAYIEFAPEGTTPKIDISRPNVMRMRTFSKAHGMAGLRCGYTIAHADLITGLNKVRNHFEMNRLAQAAALASLHDTDFVRETVAEVARGRDEIASIASQHGFTALPSATNFVAIDLGGDGAKARSCVAALGKEGVFIRMPGVAPLDRCIRVSVGTASDRALFAERFGRVVPTL